MQTKDDIDYEAVPYHLKFTIPAGTNVTPAKDLPAYGLWWALPWEGITDEAALWLKCYGFLLTAEQITGEPEA